MARKSIPGSLRWHILARDGFTCRYCGASAGQDGVELAIDHIVSVKDGGTNSPDNLATSCRKCNGGKSSRSLRNAPTPKQVIARVRKMAGNLQQQADAIQAAIAAQARVRQQIVNMKCNAYEIESCTMAHGEPTGVGRLVDEFGADKVLEWYQSAHRNGVCEWEAVRYLYGCAKNERVKRAQ